jgi:glycosyltransferase involved in cell wall biosynthesis
MVKPYAPLVSVIIPVRPNSSTLLKSLKSITSQSYRNFEIIAVLDRDNGENYKIFSENVGVIPLTVIHTNYLEIGFPEMLNLGIRASSGVYIARTDDDDYSHPNRLQLQVNLLERFPLTVLVGGWTNVVDQYGTIQYTIRPSGCPAHELLSDNVICHSSAVFLKSAALDVGGYSQNLPGCEDYDLWLKLITKGEIRTVQELIVDYFLNPIGISRVPIPVETLKQINQSRKHAQKYLKVGLFKSFSQRKKWETQQLIAHKATLLR